MASSTTLPVLCLFRGFCNTMQKTVDVIELREDGTYQVKGDVVLSELTPEELVEYNASLAEGEAYEQYMREQGWQEREIKFRTIEDALDFAEAHQSMVDTDADLHAFGAPSECYRDAMPSRHADVEAALAKAV